MHACAFWCLDIIHTHSLHGCMELHDTLIQIDSLHIIWTVQRPENASHSCACVRTHWTVIGGWPQHGWCGSKRKVDMKTHNWMRNLGNVLLYGLEIGVCLYVCVCVWCLTQAVLGTVVTPDSPCLRVRVWVNLKKKREIMRDISAETPVDGGWERERWWQEATERIKEEMSSERGVKEPRWWGDQVRDAWGRRAVNRKEFCQTIAVVTAAWTLKAYQFAVYVHSVRSKTQRQVVTKYRLSDHKLLKEEDIKSTWLPRERAEHVIRTWRASFLDKIVKPQSPRLLDEEKLNGSSHGVFHRNTGDRVAPSLSMRALKYTHASECSSLWYKKMETRINKSNWDTIRKTCVCKLLDKASQRRTKQTDGEEDVKEHSVWNSFPVFTVNSKQTNKGAIWINTTVELMAPYAYFITDAPPQSQRISCQLRQCSFVI